MPAQNTDKVTDTRNAARPNSTKATGTRSAGGTSLACDNLAGWPTASKVHFVTYQLDSSSKQVAGTQLDCSGIVTGNTIGSIVVIDGTDVGNSINDVVEMIPTAAWGQDLADALTNQHSRTGAHTGITATSITTTGNSTIGGNETVAGTLAVTGTTTLTGTTTITAPYNPYKFSVYMAGAFNFTASATILKFDTKSFDTGTNYATGTGLFTAPVTGFYFFSFGVSSDAQGQIYYGSLFQNSTEVGRGSFMNVTGSPFSTGGGSNGSKLLSLTANDTVSVQIFSDGTHVGAVGNARTFFSGFLESVT